MANEITLFCESGLNTYAIIRNSSGQAWDTAGAASVVKKPQIVTVGIR